MGGHAAHPWTDGHGIVVEDINHFCPGFPGIVQRLEGETVEQGSVADDGHHMVLLPEDISRLGKSQAAERDVLLCPASKWSKELSLLLGKPLTPPTA